jgi:hypothetical protein
MVSACLANRTLREIVEMQTISPGSSSSRQHQDRQQAPVDATPTDRALVDALASCTTTDDHDARSRA